MAETTYKRPLPIADKGSAPFWSAAKEHRLVLPRCLECGRHHFFPRELCPHCHSDRLEWVRASGRGRIYSFTVARRPAGPAFAELGPYVVALVELEEGPRMMAHVVTADVEAVRIGDAVEVAFDDVTPEVTLPRFRRAAEAGA